MIKLRLQQDAIARLKKDYNIMEIYANSSGIGSTNRTTFTNTYVHKILCEAFFICKVLQSRKINICKVSTLSLPL